MITMQKANIAGNKNRKNKRLFLDLLPIRWPMVPPFYQHLNIQVLVKLMYCFLFDLAGFVGKQSYKFLSVDRA